MITKEAVLAQLDELTNNLEGLKLIVHAMGAKYNLATANTLISRARLAVEEDVWRALDLVAEAKAYLEAAMEIHLKSAKSAD